MERLGIAADGDILLTVGNTLELRVSSVVLSLTSLVFKAMLGPNFVEGQSLRGSTSTTPHNIPLPEDDAQAVELLCRILHHQNQDIPDLIGRYELLRFAEVVDNYGCANAVKHPAGIFLRALEEENKDANLVHESGVLLQTAFLLDNAQCFARISNAYNKSAGAFEIEDDGLDENNLLHSLEGKFSGYKHLLRRLTSARKRISSERAGCQRLSDL